MSSKKEPTLDKIIDPEIKYRFASPQTTLLLPTRTETSKLLDDSKSSEMKEYNPCKKCGYDHNTDWHRAYFAHNNISSNDENDKKKVVTTSGGVTYTIYEIKEDKKKATDNHNNFLNIYPKRYFAKLVDESGKVFIAKLIINQFIEDWAKENNFTVLKSIRLFNTIRDFEKSDMIEFKKGFML